MKLSLNLREQTIVYSIKKVLKNQTNSKKFRLKIKKKNFSLKSFVLLNIVL